MKVAHGDSNVSSTQCPTVGSDCLLLGILTALAPQDRNGPLTGAAIGLTDYLLD
jgi:hypothetical protein